MIVNHDLFMSCQIRHTNEQVVRVITPVHRTTVIVIGQYAYLCDKGKFLFYESFKPEITFCIIGDKLLRGKSGFFYVTNILFKPILNSSDLTK